ncbi:MAG: DUF456 family protein [Deltaproteobacteria bacterium]|jgi:uncharacterized protein YqgC (DUF456 family)|nr:DUF456 family protein [Deltaproteobacteria bacterium]
MEQLFAQSLALAIAGGFIVLMGLVLLLNFFSLPANWILIALAAAWKYMNTAADQMDFGFFALLVGLAVLGEVLEFGLLALKAKKYGSSNPGLFAGLVGAVVGAIMCAPFLFGLGALLGALAGAWLGCYLMELLRGGGHEQAVQAAMGALVGRFLGTVCKCGIGAVILTCIARAVWPDALPLIPMPGAVNI